MSARCSICGSENTNKTSCPLNPDAPLYMCQATNSQKERLCPWHVDRVTGDRGNPLKHPLALDIMRKQQGKQFNRAAVPGEERPISGAGARAEKPLYYDKLHFRTLKENVDDDELFPEQKMDNEEKEEKEGEEEGEYEKAVITLDDQIHHYHYDERFNYDDLERLVPTLTGTPTYQGHYNLNGDLVYTSLHNVNPPHEFRGHYNGNYIFDGLVAKYGGKLYTFKRFDYAWYPLDAQDARYEYLQSVDIGDDLDNLNKYLMVHTIKAENPADLPSRITIDLKNNGKGIQVSNLQYPGQPLVGPKHGAQIRNLFKRKFSLPPYYRNFLPGDNPEDWYPEKLMNLLIKSMQLPKEEITFDLSRFNTLARFCNSPSGFRKLYHLTDSFIRRVFFLNGNYPRPNTIVDGTNLESHPEYFDSQSDEQKYLRDVCVLLNKILANNAISITPEQMRVYHDDYKNILIKYGIITPKNLKEFKEQQERYLATKKGKTASQRKAKSQYQEELLSMEPIIAQGGIYYPGGQKYTAAFEQFNLDIPWADYCYSVLDQEHLDSLKNLSSKLGIKLESKASKAQVCNLLTDYYDRKFKAEVSGIPFAYVQSPNASLEASPKASSPKEATTKTVHSVPRLPIIIPRASKTNSSSSSTSSTSITIVPPSMPPPPKPRKSIAHLPTIAPRPKRK